MMKKTLTFKELSQLVSEAGWNNQYWGQPLPQLSKLITKQNGAWTFARGKYAGKTVDDVIASGGNYMEWLLQNSANGDSTTGKEIREYCQDALAKKEQAIKDKIDPSSYNTDTHVQNLTVVADTFNLRSSEFGNYYAVTGKADDGRYYTLKIGTGAKGVAMAKLRMPEFSNKDVQSVVGMKFPEKPSSPGRILANFWGDLAGSKVTIDKARVAGNYVDKRTAKVTNRLNYVSGVRIEYPAGFERKFAKSVCSEAWYYFMHLLSNKKQSTLRNIEAYKDTVAEFPDMEDLIAENGTILVTAELLPAYKAGKCVEREIERFGLTVSEVEAEALKQHKNAYSDVAGITSVDSTFDEIAGEWFDKAQAKEGIDQEEVEDAASELKSADVGI